MNSILFAEMPTSKQLYLDARTKIILCLTVSFVMFFCGYTGVMQFVLPFLAMFQVLLLSTTVSEFIAAMDGFHILKKFSVPVSVMFRFFPMIKEEYGLIRDALRLRGIGSFRQPAEMLEYRMVPLLTELIQAGNELSASAMTRGLDAPNRRTNVCTCGFRVQDIAAFVLCIAVIIIFIFSKVTGL